MVVPPRILSLCTGLGGLDIGVEIAAPNTRVVCAIERDAYCSALLAQSMEQGRIPQAPIWDDLHTFYGRPWRGAVDCITAGYPCQPFSVAGQKRGADDTRHLWPEVFRIIGECRPPLVFLENVARHLTAGFDIVARDLQSLGYTVAALVCRAATVGAPHQRERLFALAVSDTGRERIGELAEWIEQHAPECWDAEPIDLGEGLGNFNGLERDQGSCLRQSTGSGFDESIEDLANGNGNGNGFQGEWSKMPPWEQGSSGDELDRCSNAEPVKAKGIIQRQNVQHLGNSTSKRSDGCARGSFLSCKFTTRCADLWPPGPNDLERWSPIPVELWPSIESPVRGVAHGIPDGLSFRREQLHALGNAVVPVQAAYAFVTLVRSIAERGK